MSDLDRLLEEFLAWLLEEFPVRASTLGIDGYDHRLGDFSAEAFGRREEREEEWLRRLSSIPEDGLTHDQRIDRDLVLSMLRGIVVMRDWQIWRRSPEVYLGPCLYGVFVLFLHRLGAEADLAAAAVERLRAVPRALEEGMRNLDPALASPLLVRRALGQCRAGVHYARVLVPAEVSDAGARDRLAEAGEVAARAFESFAEYLERLERNSSGPFAIGEERYSGLLLHRELLGYGAGEMRERGREAYEHLARDIARRTRELAGHPDWCALVDELSRNRPQSPEEMREAYERWTQTARAFLADRGLVTLPDGERCLVEASPAFQRPVLAVASYFPPPPFTSSVAGHFFVPYPPDGTSSEELRERLEDNNHHVIPTTSVHEAYPGHHWHLVHAKSNPRPMRKVLWTSYFVEGWALYAEDMMREQGFFTDPRDELFQVQARLFRAARIVVDTSLHIGDMTVDEAVAFMSEKAGLPEAVARVEVTRYCASPTQASSYLTGALEIERMRRSWTGDLRSFHDTLAGSGGLPVALAERALSA